MLDLRSPWLSLVLTAVFAMGASAPAWSQDNPTLRYAGGPITEAADVPLLNKKVIAVADFENHTGDPAQEHLKRGLAESLMTKLAQRTEITLVERGQLDKAIKEMGFSQSIYANPSQAKEIGKMLSADYIVVGDIVKAGNRYEINVRMLDVASSTPMVSESHLFQSENDTLLVVDYLSLLIPRKLGLYVSDRELELVRGRLQSPAAITPAQTTDNTWIYWTVGGVVVTGAIIATAIVLSGGLFKQKITQVVGDPSKLRDPEGDGLKTLRPEDTSSDPLMWQLPLLKF